MTVNDSEPAIGEQLHRIGASATFRQVDRLKRFLEFVVLETIAGRGSHLKEYVLGVQVFDKDSSFDPRADPVVRVQARRLRARLAKYYQDEGSQDSLIIEMPKGGYAPVFRRREVSPARHSVTHVLASRNTVAVAPFADQTPAGDLGYLCGGLCQEIVHALTQSPALRLLAWDGGSSQSLKEAACRMDAAMVVTGSVRRSGALIRVTAQIVEGASG
ncbi:MAG: hypothetical protein KGN84_05390, partial [Acidobacteriota bacterium]|nr:hypothetical protein [Acidobacteriota bacterium]